MKSTMVELVIELEKLKQELPESCFEIHEMIKDAKSGEYHDYKNKKYDCGKMESYIKLKEIAKKYDVNFARTIAEDIANGMYDESADEQDRENMRNDILNNTSNDIEAQALIKALNL